MQLSSFRRRRVKNGGPADTKSPPRVIPAHIGHLRRALEGSRYEIIGRLGIGYRLIVADDTVVGEVGAA